MVQCYMRNNGHGFTIYVNSMVKCVYYMGLRSNGYFMVGTALTGNHYRTDIISSVGQPRSNSIVLLVLCTIMYNIRSTDVVLQILRDSINPTGKRKYHKLNILLNYDYHFISYACIIYLYITPIR